MSIRTPRLDYIECNALLAGSVMQAQGYTNIVSANKISLPVIPNQPGYTSIVNRAKIVDLANDAGVRMGVERIMTQQIYPLQDEFGPNGELVHGVVNDNLGQIRFVGSWSSSKTSEGIFNGPGASGDFVEITFYGTGLSVLFLNYASSRTASVSVDGGSPNVVTLSTTSSSIVLTGRGYSQNVVYNLVSNLTPGLHTVKIVENTFEIYGFEILNESSTLNVRPGTICGNSSKNTLAAAQNVAYKTGFDNILDANVGTKGGCALTYIKSDNTFGKAFTPTDATALYLTNTNHANEEIVRTYNWREFGCGRSDDFSTLVSTSNRAFTIDDGTVTLICTSAANYTAKRECFLPNASSAFWTFIFVGTGLDILVNDIGSGTVDTNTMYVDGVSVGTAFSGSIVNGREYVVKLCSGLPYGTHTVKILRTSFAVGFPAVANFIVYAPKTPSLPVGAIEPAKYYVLANAAANTVAGLETISTGVIRKTCLRELTYIQGTGGSQDWIASVDLGYLNASSVATNRTGVFRYTFYGTGFDLRIRSAGDQTASAQVMLQSLSTGGSLVNLTSTNFPTMTSSTYQYLSFTPSTGILNCNNATTNNGNGLVIKDLPLGLYTVQFTNNNAASYLNPCCIDIITPIHSPKSNFQADLQNTLPVGSNSICDLRTFGQMAAQGKAWAQAVGIASNPTTTSSSYIPCPNMSVTIKTGNSRLAVSFVFVGGAHYSGATYGCRIYIDGVAVSPETRTTSAPGAQATATQVMEFPVSAGVHKVDMYWAVYGGATLTAQDTFRSLTVREI
jgi:hypothetical protein